MTEWSLFKMHSLPNIMLKPSRAYSVIIFRGRKALIFAFVCLFADLTTKARELKHPQRLDRSSAWEGEATQHTLILRGRWLHSLHWGAAWGTVDPALLRPLFQEKPEIQMLCEMIAKSSESSRPIISVVWSWPNSCRLAASTNKVLSLFLLKCLSI